MLYEDIRRGCKRYHQRYADYDHSYNKFFKEKCQPKWNNPSSLDEAEIDKIIVFLRGWNCRRRMDPDALLSTLPEVLADLKELQNYTILDVEFTEKTKELICGSFNSLANCGAKKRNGFRENESVAASKVLHLINPGLFVMWDTNIRGSRSWGCWPDELSWYWPSSYEAEFLPKVQQRVRRAVDQLRADGRFPSDEAIESLKSSCHDKRLISFADANPVAKIIDEYHFVNTR